MSAGQGGSAAYAEGRVSSRILRLDHESGIVETATGRIYHLKGPPGNHMDAEYVWNVWLQANVLNRAKDVSDEVHNGITASRQGRGSGKAWAPPCRLITTIKSREDVIGEANLVENTP